LRIKTTTVCNYCINKHALISKSRFGNKVSVRVHYAGRIGVAKAREGRERPTSGTISYFFSVHIINLMVVADGYQQDFIPLNNQFKHDPIADVARIIFPTFSGLWL